jgi:hypothetical protein
MQLERRELEDVHKRVDVIECFENAGAHLPELMQFPKKDSVRCC